MGLRQYLSRRQEASHINYSGEVRWQQLRLVDTLQPCLRACMDAECKATSWVAHCRAMQCSSKQCKCHRRQSGKR